MKAPFLFFLAFISIYFQNMASFKEYNLRSYSTKIELMKKDVQILQAKMQYLEMAIRNEEHFRKYELIPMQEKIEKDNTQTWATIQNVLNALKSLGIELPPDLQ